MLIRSPDNPAFRRWKRLASSARACRTSSRTLIEGVHLIEAAEAADATFCTLVLRASGATGEARVLAERVAQARGAAPLELAASLYDEISPVQRGVGVLAEIAFEPAPWPAKITCDAVYLDGVQDPGNVGALLRTAAAAGIGAALLGAGSATAWSPKVMRAAMGAHFALSVHDDVTPRQLRDAFGGTIVAADAGGGSSVFDGQWGQAATAWMFGGEGQGLSAAALDVADLRLRIPIVDGVESLNVAAAAAVCLFEQRRRRLSAREG